MSQNRSERQLLSPQSPVIAVEMMRQASEASKPKEEGKDDKGMPVFWRVFGSTMLSITALIIMTAYQSLSTTLGEVRNELSHLNTDLHKELARAADAQGALVKSDEADARFRSVGRSLKEMQEERKDLVALRERCAGLLTAFKDDAKQRQQTARVVQSLREKQAAEEERQALAREVEKLRERLAGLEGQRGAVRPASHREKGGE